MRLTPKQIASVRRAVAEIFGDDGEVWLFGSRVDDAERGGDIDLYIESDGTPAEILDRELRLYARLQAELGEQKMDLVVRSRDRPDRAIDRQAKQTGTRL
jgi:predicted nucleotidyltransferase